MTYNIEVSEFVPKDSTQSQKIAFADLIPVFTEVSGLRYIEKELYSVNYTFGFTMPE